MGKEHWGIDGCPFRNPHDCPFYNKELGEHIHPVSDYPKTQTTQPVYASPVRPKPRPSSSNKPKVVQEDELTKLRRQLEANQAEVSLLKSQLSNSAQTRELEDKITSLQRLLEEERAVTRGQADDLSTLRAQLNLSNDKLKSNESRLRADKVLLENKVAELQKLLHEKDEALDAKEKQLNSVLSKLGEANKQQQVIADELRSERKNIESKLQSMEKFLETQQNEKSKISEASQNRLRELEHQLSSQQSVILEQKRSHKLLEEDCQRLMNEKIQANNEKHKLETQLAALIPEINQLRKMAELTTLEKEALAREKQQLNSQKEEWERNREIKLQYDELAKERAQMVEERQMLAREREKLTQDGQYSDVQRRRDEINKEKQSLILEKEELARKSEELRIKLTEHMKDREWLMKERIAVQQKEEELTLEKDRWMKERKARLDMDTRSLDHQQTKEWEKIQTAKDQLVQERREYDRAMLLLAKEREEIERLQTSIDRERQEYLEARSKMEREWSEYRKAKAKAEEEQNDVDRVRNQLERQKIELENAERNARREREDFERAKARLDKEQREWEEAIHRLEKEKSDVVRAKADVERELREYLDAQKDYDRLKTDDARKRMEKEKQDWMNSQSRLIIEQDEMKAAQVIANKEAADVEMAKKVLKKELDEMNNANKELENEKNQMSNLLLLLQKELNEANQAKLNMKKEYEDVVQARDAMEKEWKDLQNEYNRLLQDQRLRPDNIVTIVETKPVIVKPQESASQNNGLITGHSNWNSNDPNWYIDMHSRLDLKDKVNQRLIQSTNDKLRLLGTLGPKKLPSTLLALARPSAINSSQINDTMGLPSIINPEENETEQLSQVNAPLILPPIDEGPQIWKSFRDIVINLGYLVQIKTAFQKADTQKNGYLNIASVGEYCLQSGRTNVTISQIQKMIEQVDVNRSKGVEFWEFLGIQIYLSQRLKEKDVDLKQWLLFCAQPLRAGSVNKKRSLKDLKYAPPGKSIVNRGIMAAPMANPLPINPNGDRSLWGY
eukprot:NODE_203_length_3242_cov_48.072780_g176_i0.p1 GENE.NODE_203_length_3242_cov_48.072780_g176_i0~~NODE_203_length_3242_cov_48.072780_g176_i0.p1  ORF type:complete len:1046 (+),score=310.68 NODE_203_length_3242_cov_48.072780_g176_i0:80-3139(+)